MKGSMSEKTDPHLNILLDIQKQLGVISRETGEQTTKLNALNEKVAIQNGKVFKNMQDIQGLKDEKNIEKGEKKIKGILWGAVGGVITAVIIATINKLIQF